MIERKVELQWIGPLWWPNGAMAAKHETIKLGNGPFMVDIEPTVDEIESWLAIHEGDFQSVTDWQATLIESVVETVSHLHAQQTITTTTETVIKDWDDEDNEFTWNDCMFGDGE